jgi:hypothetical protein
MMRQLLSAAPCSERRDPDPDMKDPVSDLSSRDVMHASSSPSYITVDWMRSGTGVMILKTYSPKNKQKKMGENIAQTNASFFKS